MWITSSGSMVLRPWSPRASRSVDRHPSFRSTAPWEGHSDETFIQAHHAGRRRGHYHQPRPGADCLAGSCPTALAARNLFEQQLPLPFSRTDPEHAYREGLINRWKYEQLGAAPDGDAGTEPRWLSRRRRWRR